MFVTSACEFLLICDALDICFFATYKSAKQLESSKRANMPKDFSTSVVVLERPKSDRLLRSTSTRKVADSSRFQKIKSSSIEASKPSNSVSFFNL